LTSRNWICRRSISASRSSRWNGKERERAYERAVIAGASEAIQH
jgi:hypothetical protein